MVMASSLGFLSTTYMILIQLSGIEALYALGLAQGVTMAAAELSMMIHLMSIIPKGRVGMVMGIIAWSTVKNVKDA